MNKKISVGIIGGGVSGAVTALQLSDLGIPNLLFEKKDNLVSGPPFCHLHAGGNLYPDIPLEECKTLLKQSIEMAKMFPESIDRRPTFIAIPTNERYSVEFILDRFEKIKEYYRKLVLEDPHNQILGPIDEYFKVYHKQDLNELSRAKIKKQPSTSDEWMRNAIEVVDTSRLKSPIILVQEYGWNFFRLAAQAQLALEESEHCTLKTDTTVQNIVDVSKDKSIDGNWLLRTDSETYITDYLVNSAGYKNAELEELLNLHEDKEAKHVEFKASYISNWKSPHGLIPEIIIHGERGTPHGMVQLTPYSENYYQIHGMTNEVTLFEGGLLKLDKENSKVHFNSKIQKRLEFSWDESDVHTRTKKAINSISQYIPSFQNATVGGPPLFGAQQIPGKNPDLRVGEVSFPYQNYARSEIVKASSALTVANQIVNSLGFTNRQKRSDKNRLLESVSKTDLNTKAFDLAIDRGFPRSMAELLVNES
jgi:hypothetical protein